ncbi:hypothetical protein FRC17_001871 [Serendipita sp. 399]|nr:hypothetical protein FRC17_001871 [Serendipita sp. 399]
MEDISPTKLLEENLRYLHATSAICESIDDRLPTQLSSELQNSLWQLYYSTIYARSHLPQVSFPGLSSLPRQSLSVNDNHEALVLFTNALDNVYGYMDRVKSEFSTISDTRSESEAKRFVQEACTEIQRLESNLLERTDAIKPPLHSQDSDSPISAHADSTKYKAFSQQFISIFRKNPFILSKSHFSDPLAILNNIDYIRKGLSDSIRNPCFQLIALEGKLWASNQQKQAAARIKGNGGTEVYSPVSQYALAPEDTSNVLEPNIGLNAQGSSDAPHVSAIGTVPPSPAFTSSGEVGKSNYPSLSVGPAPVVPISPSRRPIHTTCDLLLEATQKVIEQGESHAKIPGLETSWNDIIESLSRALSNIKAVTRDSKSWISTAPRFAVCGQTTTGKSTTINSLFGTNLLPTYEGGCTAWPTLIRHVPGTDKPTLRVDTTQFDGILNDIRSWNLPELDPDLPEHEELLADFDTFADPLKEAAVKFTEADYKLRPISEGVEQVQETIRAIDHLIRIYNYISPSTFPLKATGSAFPILTASLQGFASQLEPMEFLDLPGIGDDGLPSSVLLNIYTSCISSSHGIIYVQPCNRIALETRSEEKFKGFLALVMLQPEAQSLGDRPMIVVATQKDIRYDWRESHNKRFAQNYLPSYHRQEALGRVHYCAPALYVGGRVLSRAVNDAQYGVEMPDFSSLCKIGGVPEVMNWRFGRVDAKDRWNGFNIEERRKVANEAILESDMDGLKDLIQNRLYLEVKDEAYEYIMGKLASMLKDLLDQQQMILEKASVTEHDYLTASEACSIFRDQLQSFCAQWYRQRPALTVQWKNALKPHLKQAMIRAKEAVSLVVEGITEDDTITFASKIDAIRFLIKLAKAMRDPLDEVQLQLVEAVREIAHKAWTSRIQALASSETFLKTAYDNSAVESLKKQIKVDLGNLSSRRIADAMAKIVYERSESTMISDSLSTVMEWSAVQKAEQAVLDRVATDFNELTIREKHEDKDEQEKRFTEEIGSLKVHSTSDSNGRIEMDPSATSLSKATLDEGINFMGFLIRSPVLASLVSCPHTAAIWPFLSDAKPTITIDVIQRTYDNYMINAWNTIVEEESYKTLSGCIVASDTLGMRTILDAVKAKEEQLAQSLWACKEGMPPEEVEEYILLQANYVGLLGAAQELEGRLREDRTSRFKSAMSTRSIVREPEW